MDLSIEYSVNNENVTFLTEQGSFRPFAISETKRPYHAIVRNSQETKTTAATSQKKAAAVA